MEHQTRKTREQLRYIEYQQSKKEFEVRGGVGILDLELPGRHEPSEGAAEDDEDALPDEEVAIGADFFTRYNIEVDK